MEIRDLATGWQSSLDRLVSAARVPGAVAAVSHGDQRVVLVSGVTSTTNPREVSRDTAFQVGSISKIYTATLVMLLADQNPGLLDEPVAKMIPEASWARPDLLVRHLLTHTGGIGGDDFSDTGRGEDCLALYVEQLCSNPPDVPGVPGRRYSYCNAGYALLGRLIEVITGVDYDTALRRHLLEPLGARATTTLPEDSILGPVALGHNRGQNGSRPVADRKWNFSRACGPLGGVVATADDLLDLASLHLREGSTVDGRQILSPEAVAQMAHPHFVCPPWSRPDARGLGWGIYEWEGATLVGHDGETYGQIAKLRLHKDCDLALVVMTNSVPDGGSVARALETEILGTWGLKARSLPPVKTETQLVPGPYQGTFRNLEGTVRVKADGDRLHLSSTQEAEGLDSHTAVSVLAPIDDDLFVDVAEPRPSSGIRFSDPDSNGRHQCLFRDGRVSWRVDA